MTSSLRQTSWYKWNKLRKAVLRRDKYLCQPCDKAGRVRQASEVDHIIALDNGGTDNLDNLQAICPACHKMKTNADLGHGMSSACDRSGRPLDPRHPWNSGEQG